MNPVKKFALAASFVTCIPLCRLPSDAQSDSMSGLAKYLPAVGVLIGLLLAALAIALEIIHANNILTAAFLTVTWLWLTGGIHFDGLMDTADGIFSHREPARMLEIMSDSRVGNFGAMAGFCVCLLKFASLATLPFPALLAALVLVPAWARWCETFAIGAFPYLREKGMGKIWHDTTRCPVDLIVAGALPAVLTVAIIYVGSAWPLIVGVATIVPGLAASFWLNAKLKGHTGDTYGAVVEIAEFKALLLLALLVHIHELDFILPHL